MDKRTSNHIVGIQITGNAMHYFKNKQLLLEDSCVFFLNQKEEYDVKVREIGTAFSIHFTTYEPILTDSFCIKISKTNEIIRMLELIETEFMSKNDELELLSSFYEFCSQLNRIYEKTFFSKDSRIIDAEKYINAHFRENDCLEKSVESCNLSQRRFNDLFKMHFNMTPNRYITNLKINYAKKLLQTEYISISQVASLCGFNDIYYFSKFFKKETSLTPSMYRKLIT